MAKFTNNNLVADGDYILLRETGNIWDKNNRFVARFKHGGKRRFLSFLKKNFTVAEYFELMEKKDARGVQLSPGQVLESKGFLTDYRVKLCKENGYTPDIAGYRQYCIDTHGEYTGLCPA